MWLKELKDIFKPEDTIRIEAFSLSWLGDRDEDRGVTWHLPIGGAPVKEFVH